MALWLRQLTVASASVGPFISNADFKTASTSLTIAQADVQLSKNGAAYAQKNGSATAPHQQNGFYVVTLDGTDTNTLGTLRLTVSLSTNLHVWQDYQVISPGVYDALVTASNSLAVDAVEFASQSTITDALVNNSAVFKISSNVWATGSRTLSSFNDTLFPDAAVFRIATNVWATGTTFQRAVYAATVSDQVIYRIATGVWATGSAQGDARIVSVGDPSRAVLVSSVWATGSRTLTAFNDALFPDAAVFRIATNVWATGSVSGRQVHVATISDQPIYRIATSVWATGTAADAGGRAVFVIDAGPIATASMADGLLNRNLAMGGSGNTRRVQQALRVLRNRVNIATDTNTAVVYEEDDSTTAWTMAVATDSLTSRISGVDPST